jgi:hypothetical protein
MMTYGEMFLFVWAMGATFLFFIKQRDMEVFKQFTVYKLKQVAKGEAVVVVDDESVQIISKGKV